MTTDELTARVAELSDGATAALKAALPPSLVRKKLEDYSPEEIAATAALVDAIAAEASAVTPEMLKAEAEAPVIGLDDLPSMIETRRLKVRLGAANSPELNAAWVAAGLGSLPDLMDPETYVRAEAVCATHEPGVLSGEEPNASLRSSLQETWTAARALPDPVRGRTLYLLSTECGGPSPVPLTQARVAHATQILDEARKAAEALPPSPASLPPVGQATIPPAPTPPDGTIDEIMEWVEADPPALALRAAVARSHELARPKPRKRLLTKLDGIAGTDAPTSEPHAGDAVVDEVEPTGPPTVDVPSPEPEASGDGDPTASNAGASGTTDGEWRAAVAVALADLEDAVRRLADAIKETTT